MSMGVGQLFTSMTAALALGLAPGPASRAEGAPRGAGLVRTYCSGCHREHDGGFERISAIRKTPEGWAMTLARMRLVHGWSLDDDDAAQHRRAILADTRDLRPRNPRPAALPSSSGRTRRTSTWGPRSV